MSRSLLLYGHRTEWRLGASYRRAFQELGFTVDVMDVGRMDDHLSPWLRHRVGRRLTRCSLRLRRLGSKFWNRRLIERARSVKPNIVFLIAGQMVMPETVDALRAQGQSVAVFFPDDPMPSASESRPEHLEIARAADRAFVWSRRRVRDLEEAGAGPAHYLPFAWDPEVFPFVSAVEDESYEVVFIGGWDRHRERWLAPVAEAFDLRIWGPDYWGTRTPRGSALRSAWQGQALLGRPAAEVTRRAAIVLNVLRKQNLPDGTNMRTFEVPGAGGFIVAHRTAGATEILPEGEAGSYFDSVEEMLTTIDRLLAEPGSRKSMRRRAHEIVASDHRYVNRARRVLEYLGTV